MVHGSLSQNGIYIPQSSKGREGSALPSFKDTSQEVASPKVYKQCMLQRVWRKENLPTLWVRKGTCTNTMENSMEVPEETSTDLPYDPAIPVRDIHREKTVIRNDTCTSVFIATLFTTGMAWKQPMCNVTEESMKKTTCYTQWNISQP